MLKANRGFTIIELMVVVAIISILGQLSVSNFESMAAKARQTEAKLILGDVYLSQKSFYAEHGFYTTCLNDIQSPDLLGPLMTFTSPNWRSYPGHYLYGTDDRIVVDGQCGGPSFPGVNCRMRAVIMEPVITLMPCTGADQTDVYNGFIGDKIYGFPKAGSPADNLTTLAAWNADCPAVSPKPCHISRNSFVIQALGNISDGLFYDTWVIDEEKKLRNTRSGLQ